MDWREEMLRLTVLYRMLECGDEIPVNTMGTDYSFIERTLEALHADGCLEISSNQELWIPTARGREFRDKMVEMFDHALKFEIFGQVRLERHLSEEESEDGALVFHQLYDPRFQDPNPGEQGVEDMRLAMMSFLAHEMGQDAEWKANVSLPLDPRRIVFLQKLSDGELRGDIWFDLRLGTFFDKVDEIVDSAFKWTDLGDGASDVMKDLYTAGMLEQRKRDGCECSGCGTPLAAFETDAKESGEELRECPNPDCRADFNPPGPDGDEYECPNCQTGVGTLDHLCRGCGAVLDFSRPPGTIVEETVVEEEPVWSSCYGYDYVPYGYYSPYDPFYDMVGFACLCAVLW